MLALLAASCAGGGDRHDGRRPDVVLVVIDTLRADRLSCYGYPRTTSPRMDTLAADGTRFTDVTAQSSWTLPSMVSLFSGRYLTAYRDFMQPDRPTLAETFQASGYRTVGVVGNILLQPSGGYGRGFDHYDAQRAEPGPGGEGPLARSATQLTDALWGPLDEALDADDDGRRPPLFLYLHPFDPHNPYRGDASLDSDLSTNKAAPFEPPDWPERTLADRGPSSPDAWRQQLSQIRESRGLYDQDVRLTDAAISDLLDGLQRRGVLDHAVVAIVSDHGEGLWERVAPMKPDELTNTAPPDFFYQQHGAYLYREALFTPFILQGHGVPAGRVVDLPVENVDLFPTLLELCEVPARGRLDGRSLLPLLRGEDPGAWRETVHAHVTHMTSIRDVRTGEKLMVPNEIGVAQGARPEFFHLGQDPLERSNEFQVDSPAVQRLQDLMDRWRDDHPTESTLGVRPDAQVEQDLKALGYTEEHTGRR